MASAETRRSPVRVDVRAFGSWHWLVVALALVSGVLHLYIYTTEDYLPFLLAGAGFFGAVALLVVLPDYRKYLYPVGVVFVGAQIVGYVTMGSSFDTALWVDAVDKGVQVLLVAILAWFSYEEWT